jgi:F-type H+-transporting ATPase subunit gamma
MRLHAVSNIAKITKSMKMIAATKLTRAQRNMETARVYGQASNAFFEQTEATTNAPETSVYITVSSDRGLCGGVHSAVSKATKRAIKKTPNATAVVLGDKAKMQLARDHRGHIALSFSGLGKAIPTFEDACGIADALQASGVTFDKAEIVYNAFTSMISYVPSYLPVYSQGVFKEAPKFAQYEVEDDVLDNLYEFSVANSVFWALSEGYASEMAAKRMAMENATKNAGEMIDRLTMTYNRGRQAVITNELIEIIVGASAL